jgi:hypothetical protein
VKALLREPDVTQSSKKGFGSTALWTNRKIFALLSSKGEFVVKLSRQRVDALVAAGEGRRFEPGPGRVMKEWLVADTKSNEKWLALAKEAMKAASSKH